MHKITQKSIPERKWDRLPFNRKWGLCCLWLLVSCLSSMGQVALKVSIQLSNVSLKEAFKAIETQSGYIINYSMEEVNVASRVSVNVKDASVKDALSAILRTTPYRFEFDGSVIIVKAKPREAPKSATGRVAGKIVDGENGQPIPGATVMIGNKGATTDADGAFSFAMPNGKYTARVSCLGYSTKEVAEIDVSGNGVFSFNATLKRGKGQLAGVTIKASARKESTAAFYARQKNAATVTDGISFEQLNRLPDNNVGAALKRVSGVSVVDNKYVVVRGLTERYNQAMLDGLVLPSTDPNKRNFAFDLIPNEMVGEIVVNKTASPDLSAEFVGGQVLVKTLDIPTRNFTTISIGGSSNSQTLGKDFYNLGKRQSRDYFATEGGNRNMPANAVSWTLANQQDDPTQIVTGPTGYKYGYEGAIEQSKKFNADGFRLYQNKAGITPNLKFIIGRVYSLDTAGNKKIGFTGGLTYRHRTQTDNYRSTRGLGLILDEPSFYSNDSVVKGNIYNFSTNATALLNIGFSSGRHKVTLRNIYSRNFEEDYNRSLGFPEDMLNGRIRTSLVVPAFTVMRQHKLEGEHRITRGGLLLNWMAGYAGIDQSYKDIRSFYYGRTKNAFGDYYQAAQPSSNAVTQSNWSWPYRLWSDVKQTDYTWGLDLSQPFKFLQGNSLVKLGYAGWDKKRSQSMHVFKLYTVYRGIDVDYLPYHILMDADHVGTAKGEAYYWGDIENGDKAASASEYKAGYLMLDQRFAQNKLRLVYGLRAENFGLANKQLNELRKRQQFELEHPDLTYNGVYPELTGEKNWNFLPSANLTWSLTPTMNIRAAYSQTMIRPTFRETSVTAFPDPQVPALVSGGNISSTKISNKDLRFEWYPHPGDMLSFSAFHKGMDKPVELVVRSVNTSPIAMAYQNQHSATSMGLEMEFRKNLGFIHPLVRNFTFYGNGAYFDSKVVTINEVADPADPAKRIRVLKELDRPLVGQSPFLINLGLLYENDDFSGNMVFNQTGYRPFFAVDGNPQISEFRAGYGQLDLQIAQKLLKKKAELKLNISNLLNGEEFYYRNLKGYKTGMINGKYQIIKLKYYVPEDAYFPADPVQNIPYYSFSDFVKLKDNYSDAQGDQKTFSIKRGVNVSFSFTYSF